MSSEIKNTRFSYSKDGLTVSYEGVVVTGRFNLPDVLTVADQGTFDIDINGEKRVDTVTKEHRAYIQSCLDDTEEDVHKVGNKVCEIYYDMIK
jgi:hypothetical protein